MSGFRNQNALRSVYYVMNTPPAPSLFPNAEPNTSHARTHINACLWFDDCAGYRVIWCRHEILYRVALHDTYHLALIAVTLRQSELATQTDISAAFGHSVATQRRWETRYCLHGNVGLQAKKPTGRHPALDHGQCTFVKRWFEQGVNNHEMARRLAVSETTIRRVLHQAGLCRKILPVAELFLNDAGQTPAVAAAASAVAATVEPAPAAAPAAVPVSAAAVPAQELRPDGTSADAYSTTTLPSAEAAPVVSSVVPTGNAPARPLTIDRDPTDRCGDRCLARLGLLDDAAPLFGNHEELPRAGVLLAVPVLLAHGALEVFARLFGSIGPAFYGLRTTVLSLVLLALLRIKRP